MAEVMNFWYRLPFRVRLGIISAVLVILAAGSFYYWVSDPIHHKPLSGLIRIAPILLLLCLAWSDLKRIPRWWWLLAPVVIIVGMKQPMLWFIIVPAVFLWLFLHN